MHVQMRLAVAPHPCADHERFGKVGEVQQEPRQIHPRQLECQRQPATIPAETPAQRKQMRGSFARGAGKTMAFHAIGPPRLFALWLG